MPAEPDTPAVRKLRVAVTASDYDQALAFFISHA